MTIQGNNEEHQEKEAASLSIQTMKFLCVTFLNFIQQCYISFQDILIEGLNLFIIHKFSSAFQPYLKHSLRQIFLKEDKSKTSILWPSLLSFSTTHDEATSTKLVDFLVRMLKKYLQRGGSKDSKLVVDSVKCVSILLQDALNS